MTGEISKQQRRKEGELVRSHLAAIGWSCAKLARKTGLAHGTVRNVLAGNHPGFPAMAAINAALGRDFFSMRNQPTVSNKVIHTGELVTKGTRLVEIPEGAWVMTVEDEQALLHDLIESTKRYIRKNF